MQNTQMRTPKRPVQETLKLVQILYQNQQITKKQKDNIAEKLKEKDYEKVLDALYSFRFCSMGFESLIDNAISKIKEEI